MTKEWRTRHYLTQIVFTHIGYLIQEFWLSGNLVAYSFTETMTYKFPPSNHFLGEIIQKEDDAAVRQHDEERAPVSTVPLLDLIKFAQCLIWRI